MGFVDDLRRIHIFGEVPADLLEKLQPITQVTIFSERNTIFREGQQAEYFYALIKGKVLLEAELAENILVTLDSIDPGEAFGWPALFPNATYCMDALCAEPCEVFRFKGAEMAALMDENPFLGYHLAKGVMNLLKSRVDKRTDHLLKILRMHPDLGELLSSGETSHGGK